MRYRTEVNTDPQRRCYDGHHFSSLWQWTAWRTIDSGLALETAERRLAFWRELNEYAVSQRGESARHQYEITKGE